MFNFRSDLEQHFGQRPGDLLWDGLKVVKSPLCTPVPRVQLSSNYRAGTEEGIASMNAWLLMMFGTKEIAFRAGDTCYVSPGAYSYLLALRRAEPVVRGLLFDYGGT